MPRVARPLPVSRCARWRTLLALVALLGLLGPLPANTAPRALAATTAPTVERVCGDPAPGEYACYAVRQIRGGGAGAFDMTPSGYGPAQLQAAYNLTAASASNGAGQTIAIIDAYDNPNAEADLAVYRAQFGLPPCTTANGCFRKINQNGLTSTLPAPDTGWAGEIALDLDMASAICPNCKLLLVEADSAYFSDLSIAFTQAVTQGTRIISNSYGGSESTPNESVYSAASAAGVAITFSSGDNGYGVSFPASSQYVTAVGGTSLTYNSGTNTYGETAWYNGIVNGKIQGAGSGCSAYIPKPAWQTDSGCTKRTVADVSAVADPYTGVATYSTYGDAGWNVYGGTSAAAPIIAGVYALAGYTGTTPRNKLPYDNPSQLFDVTSGSTGSCGGTYLCTARSGYDGPTGLGSPNGLGAFGGPNVGTTPRPAPPVTPVPSTPTPTKTATPVTPTPTPVTPTPAPVTFAVSATASGDGTVSPAGTTSYQAGTVASYTAAPAAGQVFLGWALDGQYVGYANPLTITVNGAHTLVARFAARPAFTDVPANDPDYGAITTLAALGIVNPAGVNGSGQFQPARGVARAEVAAFVARVFGWQNEAHANRFPDQCDPNGQNCLDAELWNTVAALQDYGVVGGYTDGATCAASGTVAPCYLPRDPVLRLQIVSIVARAFTKAPDVRATGFWDRLAAVAGQYTNVPDSGTQRSDLATYRANAGPIPGQSSDTTFPAPTDPASRRFVIETLWQAYNAVYGVDRVP